MFTGKEYQCVCHTFYQEVFLNSWKVVFVWVPLEADLEVRVIMYYSMNVFIL